MGPELQKHSLQKALWRNVKVARLKKVNNNRIRHDEELVNGMWAKNLPRNKNRKEKIVNYSEITWTDFHWTFKQFVKLGVLVRSQLEF